MLSLLKKKIENSNLSFKIAILICIFATGSWVEINGIWVELPVLVNSSPQQWTLPSYLTVVIQLANVGPLIYVLSNRYVTYKSKQVVTERPVIYILLGVGVIASFILAFTWHTTTLINGKLYSAALIALSFFLALVDCTSSVTFLPFMAYFPKEYMTIFYVGEGMSGLLPSVAALIQGVGEQSYQCKTNTKVVNTTVQSNYITKNVTEIIPEYFQTEPLFSAKIFFFIISAMMLSSFIAYVILVRIINKTENSSTLEDDMKVIYNNSDSVLENITVENNGDNMRHDEISADDNENNNALVESEISSQSWKTVIYLLVINSIINGISNGVLPAIQSYACLPYGDNIYHLTLSLSAVMNPVFCFLYFFVSVESLMKISLGVVVYLVSASYTIGVASKSPCPYLLNNDMGGVLVLIITVLGVGIVSYLKTAISTKLRHHGYKALLWNGISVQIGSLIGACIVFPLVNVYGVFKQSIPCQPCY